MTDEQIEKVFFDALNKTNNRNLWRALTREKGAYSIDVPNTDALLFVRNVIEAAKAASTAAQPVQQPRLPNPDEIRGIAKNLATSASDSPSPSEYVAAGWRAAMQAAQPVDMTDEEFAEMKRSMLAAADSVTEKYRQAAQPVDVPAGYKLVPDYKVGMDVMFRGVRHRIFALGDRSGTFDIQLEPKVPNSDRWVNVPPDMLEIAPKVS